MMTIEKAKAVAESGLRGLVDLAAASGAGPGTALFVVMVTPASEPERRGQAHITTAQGFAAGVEELAILGLLKAWVEERAEMLAKAPPAAPKAGPVAVPSSR